MRIGIIHDSVPIETENPEDRIILEHRRHICETIQIALHKAGHQSILISATETIFEQLRDCTIDIAFNLVSGIHGEGRLALVPSILDQAGIPYTGPGALAHTVALDKPTTKRILQSANINTPKFQLFSKERDIRFNSELKFPLFVKPARGGCGYGINDQSYVTTEQQLIPAVLSVIRHCQQPALVEEFMPGREFTVGILGNADNLRVLPILEHVLGGKASDSTSFRTFEKKMNDQRFDQCVCPAPIKSSCANQIMEIALATYQLVGCCDFARIDIRLNAHGIPYVLEINSLPGLEPNDSYFPLMAYAGGFNYDQLIQTILFEACQRYDPIAEQGLASPTIYAKETKVSIVVP
jgi:D-alanine-D-alanine ligase